MDFRVFIEPQQGASYEQVLRLALAAEALGFNGFFTSDHLLKMSAVSGLPGPLDAWTTLTGLARDTSRLRLGPLVSPVTFRQPGLLAVTVAQIDHMSKGRIEFGLGAGWFADEHAAHGIPFPPLRTRFDMLEEQLALITGAWRTPVGEQFEYRGEHYRIAPSLALPKPVQLPTPPIIVGGKGHERIPRLAARYATEFNMAFVPFDEYRAQRPRVEAACAAIGRDANELVWSCALQYCCGATEREFTRRARNIDISPAAVRANGLGGLPDEVIATIRKFRSLGIARIYLQVLDLDDLEHLELFISDVAPFA
jgi:F420-dependent oxidoreductase-like protein